MEPWLRLANLQLSSRNTNLLLDRFGDPEALFNASVEELLAIAPLSERLLARLADPSIIPTAEQLSYLERTGARAVGRDHAEYPRQLRDIPDPPAMLFILGEIEEVDRFAVGIVGSRHATPYGRSVTARISADLAKAGLTVVSGGAIGIDTAAHQAVASSEGRTIVVLGCGLDVDYPRENRRLFEKIVEERRGAIVTEYPLGAQPDAWRFPLRNRIISGLSMGVVVVEAGERSGALLTATNATEQGREVMAVPGNVDRPGSKGTNALIRDGAALVEDARDILRVLGILSLESPEPAPRPSLTTNLPENQKRILATLSLTPRHIDAIASEVGLPPSQVSVEMTMLELAGFARRLPGNCYIRAL